MAPGLAEALCLTHPQVRLKKGFLVSFQRAAVDRVRLSLHPKGFRAIPPVDPNGKAAQKRALALRTTIVHRWAPGQIRSDESTRLAAPFLDGMESPPKG